MEWTREAVRFGCRIHRECGIRAGMLPAILIGALSGLIAALCGVGGGVIMVPLFVSFLGLSQKQAVATSLCAMVLTALISTVKNHTNGFVDWRVAVPCAISAGIVAWFASDAMRQMSNRTLTVFFALVMITMGVRMLFSK